MNTFLFTYLIIGVLIATLPMIDNKYKPHIQHQPIPVIIVGALIIAALWPLLMFMVFKTNGGKK